MPKKNKKDNIIISSDCLYDLTNAISAAFAVNDFFKNKNVIIYDYATGQKMMVNIKDKNDYSIHYNKRKGALI